MGENVGIIVILKKRSNGQPIEIVTGFKTAEAAEQYGAETVIARANVGQSIDYEVYDPAEGEEFVL